eukprot:1747485-Alexandrium_andersonii.AAC.1
MAASPARLRVQEPRRNIPRTARRGAVPICGLGVVAVFSEEGLVSAVSYTHLTLPTICSV